MILKQHGKILIYRIQKMNYEKNYVIWHIDQSTQISTLTIPVDGSMRIYLS